MTWFYEQKVRWIVIFYGLVILILFLTSCATAPSSRKYVGSVLDLKTPGRMEESFATLWEKRTVQFGRTTRGGIPLPIGSLVGMSSGEGQDGGGSEFPLNVTATWMDSLLIETGLQHYANLIEMTPEEETAFRNAYFQRYDAENHILIWCELQTTWTERFLDLNRWLVFIEDDAINQHEPVRILEKSQSFREMTTDRLNELPSEQGHRAWVLNQKALMLCFTKRDFYGNPILSEKVKFIKLVFQLNDDEKTKAEGIWVFKK